MKKYFMERYTLELSDSLTNRLRKIQAPIGAHNPTYEQTIVWLMKEGVHVSITFSEFDVKTLTSAEWLPVKDWVENRAPDYSGCLESAIECGIRMIEKQGAVYAIKSSDDRYLIEEENYFRLKDEFYPLFSKPNEKRDALLYKSRQYAEHVIREIFPGDIGECSVVDIKTGKVL